MKLAPKYLYMIIAVIFAVVALFVFAIFVQNSALFSQLFFVIVFVGIIGGGYMLLKYIRDHY